MSCLAIDKFLHKHPLASVIQMDCTLIGNQQLVLSWIQQRKVHLVVLEPPCGTASQARAIPLPGVEKPPQPLRSFLQPDGLDGLSELDRLRVGAANVLYAFTAACVETSCMVAILAMVENPANSFFWLRTPWMDMTCHDELFVQDHRACAYGSDRPKLTRLCANFKEVFQCPGDHEHAAWGVQRVGNKRVHATSLEVHYPRGLCDAISTAFLMALQRHNVISMDALTSTALTQAFSGVQPAGNKLPPLVPEFKHKIVVAYDQDQNILWPCIAPSVDNCKLLHTEQLGNKSDSNSDVDTLQLILQVCHSFGADPDFSECRCIDKFSCVKIFGSFWEPEEFIQQVILAGHPFADRHVVPGILIEAMDRHMNSSDLDIARSRLHFVKKWSQRAKELSDEEEKLKAGLDPQVVRVIEKKRILLYKEMLVEAEYPDLNVVNELVEGAELVGPVERTNMMPDKSIPALLSANELGTRAMMVRPGIESTVTSSGDAEIDASVWAQTLEEVNNHWLKGPIATDCVPTDAPIARRFGLKQRRKIRLTDDFTGNGVNQAVETCEAPSLHTIDVAAAMISVWFNKCYATARDPTLQGKTFDLNSAYKQVPLSAAGREQAHICVFDPTDKKPKLLQCQVLPFGGVRSVHGFLRLARGLWWIGVVLGNLLWTSFYDDFILVSSPSLKQTSEATATALFRLAGWLFADEGRKWVEFKDEFSALGVMFRLQQSNNFICEVANTASRVEEIVAEIDKVHAAGKISKHDSARLRGRMVFAEAQLFGRVGRRCVKALADFASGFRSRLNSDDVFFFELFKQVLLQSRPRLVTHTSDDVIFIFTDACYERDAKLWPCGLGGVCIDAAGSRSFFSVEVDEATRTALGELHKKQIIFECETIAALVAMILWTDKVRHRRCILFVDNEGSKYCILKCSSENEIVDALVRFFAEIECDSCVRLWISRVASHSNIADGPSRGVPPPNTSQPYKCDSADARLVLNSLVERLKKWGMDSSSRRPK